MRPFAPSFTFVLGLLALACASAAPPVRETPPAPEPAPEPEPERPSFDALHPLVGEKAPTISLETLTGQRVTLPGSAADRAAVLIFGSFS